MAFGLVPEAAGAAAPLRHGGRDVELSITPVSQRTVRVTLRPTRVAGEAVRLDGGGVLAPRRWGEPALRVAVLDGPREVVLEEMRVRVTVSPLACEVVGTGGKMVLRLEFGGDDGVVRFALGSGPPLGLGEGAQQFDRRLHRSLEDGGSRRAFGQSATCRPAPRVSRGAGISELRMSLSCRRSKFEQL